MSNGRKLPSAFLISKQFCSELIFERQYVKITKDFTLRAAKAFQTLSTEAQPLNFVYVSGLGATLQPGRFTPIFARVKGETEIALAEMRKANPAFRSLSIRPAGIDATNHRAIQPYLPTPGLVKRLLLPPTNALIRNFWPSVDSPTEPLGKFMTEMAMGKWDAKYDGVGIEKLGHLPILENKAFRRLAELDVK